MSANEQAHHGDREQQPTACGACGSDFVHAADWQRQDGARWWFLLRCGGCDDEREAVLTHAAAERLEDHIERGMEEIAAAARRIDQERMAAQAEIFITALDRNLIDPADFRRAA
jgi:hypothetical protein